ILVNPGNRAKDRLMSRPRLYDRMLALGKRAGVPDAHPHRYRDTYAVDCLLRGLSVYDVAKLLGDTVETVERHYGEFVKELRDRVRHAIDNGQGLENCTVSTQQPASTHTIQ